MPRRSSSDWLTILFCGMCMGAADIVPGISGGTIAFIMGFYSRLLDSVKTFNLQAFTALVQFRVRDFLAVIAWRFLLPLFCGVALSFILLAKFFDSILNHDVYRVYFYSIFLGLIVASVYFCAKQISEWKPAYWFGLTIGIITAVFLTGASLKSFVEEPLYDVKIILSESHNAANYDVSKQMLLNVPESVIVAMAAKGIVHHDSLLYSHSTKRTISVRAFEAARPEVSVVNWWIVGCGSIAICAMLLPGISGSYLLSILGVYGIVIGALADLVEAAKTFVIDFDALQILASMMLGIIAGGLVFSRFVSWLLTNFRDLTIATLTGFMVGALRSVWPFWSSQYILNPLKLDKGLQLQILDIQMPSVVSLDFFYSVLCMIAGFLLVIVVEYAASRRDFSNAAETA